MSNDRLNNAQINPDNVAITNTETGMPEIVGSSVENNANTLANF